MDSMNTPDFENFYQRLLRERGTIGLELVKPLSKNPQSWPEELALRIAWIGQVSEWADEAEYHYQVALAEATEALMTRDPKPAANLIEKLAKGATAKQDRCRVASAQIFKTLIVQIDAIRTLISNAKAERGVQ